MAASYTENGYALVFGKPRVWSPHPLPDLAGLPVGTYDCAPDGKLRAVILNGDGTADQPPITQLTFLLNFFDDLQRRVPAAQ
jgi:hypothetical protein